MPHRRDVRSAAAVLLAFVLGACGGTSETEPAASVPTMDISPTSVTLPAGGGQTFAATVTGASAPTLAWSATGGTITASGQYTAPSVQGDYEVTVILTADPAVRATAAVTVNPAPVKSVSLSPSQPTVTVGATQVFTARVIGGSTSAVDWRVEPNDGSGGRITADGVYTAPDHAGTVTVVATTRATPITTATATVTVTDTPVPTVRIVDTSLAGDQQHQPSQLINGESRVFQAVISGTALVDVTWSVVAVSSTSADSTLPAATPGGLFTVLTASDRPGSYLLRAEVRERVTARVILMERAIDVLLVTLSVNPETPTLPAGGTTEFETAVHTDDGLGHVTDDEDSAEIRWTVQEANGGTVVDSTGVYTAPLIGGLYHVVASHTRYTAKSASATVNVQTVSMTLSPPTPSVEAGALLPFTASVTNVVEAHSQVTWSIQEGAVGGSVTQNSFDSTSGQSLATYRAPTRVGSRAFHVVATSVADPSRRAVATVTILGVWKSIAAGGHHTVAIQSNGTLWAWGRNLDGQLGDGTNVNRLTPVPIGNDNTWVMVVAGAKHTMALKTDGTLHAWGGNDHGQLGDGSPSSRTVPTLIDQGPWKLVSTRGHHVVGVKTDGTLWAWGDNVYGQVGNGQSGAGQFRTTPTSVVVTRPDGSPLGWSIAAAGTNHTLAIATDGTLWAWGFNESGQLGDGSAVDRNVPTRIGADSDWIAIDAGVSHSAGVRGDPENPATGGTLWAWGDNGANQLGEPTVASSASPIQVSADTDWVSVYLGEHHTMASKTNQRLWGWGHNVHGELGLGPSGAPQQTEPVALGGVASQQWFMADSGLHHTVMLTADGHLWITGASPYGQIGDGTSASTTVPVRAGGASSDWRGAQLAAGAVHTAAIKVVGLAAQGTPQGTFWAWGNNERGQLGDGTGTDRDAPIQIGDGSTWTQVGAGRLHTAGVKADGSLWTWGDNTVGQLGVGDQTDRSVTPTEVPKRAAADPWVGVAAGAYHTVAITRNGQLWAWGANGSGQVGKAPDLSRPAPYAEFLPVLIDDPRQNDAWITLAAGEDHTLAIKREVEAGIGTWTLWAWGRNDSGQVGDGTTIQRSTPTEITVDAVNASLVPDWFGIAAGGRHTMGLKGAGTLWAWGDNEVGQAGVPTASAFRAPTPVDQASNWQAVSAGSIHTAVIAGVGVTTDNIRYGSLWTWGGNTFGQLGNGATTPRTVPGRVGLDATWSAVSAGDRHTVAVKVDGTLWAWGVNDSGQLGDDSAWRSTLIEVQ